MILPYAVLTSAGQLAFRAIRLCPLTMLAQQIETFNMLDGEEELSQVMKAMKAFHELAAANGKSRVEKSV